MSVHKQHPWTKPRAHTRFLLDLRLVVRGKDTQHGRTKDIAEGGLGATIPGEMEIGEVVELETGSQNQLQDLDTPQDYDRYLRETRS